MSDLIERIPEGFTPGPWWVSGKQTIRQGEHIWIAKAFWQATERDVRLIALAPELAAGYRAQAARIAEIEGERDRQYDQNVEQIVYIAELEAEVARLRSGWASAQTENASLRELVCGAYREGVRGGMRGRGLRWPDSASFRRLGALNYASAAPEPTATPVDVPAAASGAQQAALAAPDTGGAGGEWACQGGTRMHCHVFCTCDGSKAEEIDHRL